MENKHTPGPWDFACDSYGKVRHSKKACVFTMAHTESGAEYLTHVASRIPNWDDARLIAAAPDLLTLAHNVAFLRNSDLGKSEAGKLIIELADAAIAKATGK